MDEETAFRAIRNAIHLENLSRETAAKVAPYLRQAYQQLQELIESLPEDALFREQRYRALQEQIRQILQPASDTFQRELDLALIEEAPKQLNYAQTVLGAPEEQFPPLQLTRTQIVELATDSSVLNKKLETFFQGQALYIKAAEKQIDRVVKQGFLLGETNEQIARNLKAASNATLRDTRAIARTAVMDMSQRANERFWDANSSVIKLWEFDATFDYRVCPQCYPHDGERKRERSDLPSVPVHPNCRCRVLPITETELELEKKEMKEGMVMSTVQVGKPNQGGRKERVYKTKVTVDGKKVTRFAKEYAVPRGQRPTMAFFLRRANNETREQVLGKGNAKRFAAMLASGRDEQEALRDIIANPTRRRK